MMMTRKMLACDYVIDIPTDVCPKGAKIISHTSNKPTHTYIEIYVHTATSYWLMYLC